MRIAIVSSRYPSKSSPYEYAFVHTRAKEYQRRGEKVAVFVPAKVPETYVLDGITVQRLPTHDIIAAIDTYDIVMTHLLHVSHIPEKDGGRIYRFIVTQKKPAVIFIHGIEVQRMTLAYKHKISLSHPRSLAVAAYHDFFQIPRIKHFFQSLLTQHPAVRFVVPSQWMLAEAKRNTGLDLRAKTVVIPNGINTRLFTFEPHWTARHKVLTIRPLFLKGKYAVDLALDTMRHLPLPTTLNIYGKGPDAKAIRALLRSDPFINKVHLIEKFVPHAEMPQLFQQHGLYYAVTRMDAQGVTMCEAMAAGLPVVSFRTCGIPEFVKDGETGLLAQPYDVREAAALIRNLVEDQRLYVRLTENARRFVESIDIQRTTEQEIALAKTLSV